MPLLQSCGWRGSHWLVELYRYRHCISIISISCCIRGSYHCVSGLVVGGGHCVPAGGCGTLLSVILGCVVVSGILGII